MPTRTAVLQNIKYSLVPSQAPALIRYEQQKTMMSTRQLGSCHVQPTF